MAAGARWRAHGIGWRVAYGTRYWLEGYLWHTVLVVPIPLSSLHFYPRHCTVHGMGNMVTAEFLYGIYSRLE